MKICILAYALSTGGFTSSLLPILKHLKKQNIQADLMLFNKDNNIKEDNTYVNIIYNDTPKKEFGKIKKLYYLAKSPTFIKNYIKYTAVNLTCKFKRKTEKSEKVQAVYAMALGQAILSRLPFEYTQKCDLSSYDCVVAWEECFASYFLAVNVIAKKKIGYVHPDYEKAYFIKEIDKRFFDKLDEICFVSKATKKSFLNVFPEYYSKCHCVYNLLDVDDVKAKSKADIKTFEKSSFDIVSVCRLDNKSKALSRGVKIIAKLISEGCDLKWYIAGDGPSRGEIEEDILKYKMQDTIFLLGNQANPHPFTKKADLFLLQSIYEGKPMSVDEAMIIGTPVLISNFASAKEQIEDEITGFIAENNEQAIYEKLKFLLDNKDKLEIVRQNLKSFDTAKFTDTKEFLSVVKGGE